MKYSHQTIIKSLRVDSPNCLFYHAGKISLEYNHQSNSYTYSYKGDNHMNIEAQR